MKITPILYKQETILITNNKTVYNTVHKKRKAIKRSHKIHKRSVKISDLCMCDLCIIVSPLHTNL